MRSFIDQTPHLRQRLSRYVFTASDQRFIGGLSLCGAICLAGSLGLSLVKGQGLVDIDQVEPTPPPFVLDVNAATWPELAQLPGIGEVLARRITGYRNSRDQFESVQDLQHVHGIGPLTAERLEPYFPSLRETQREDR